MRFTSITISVLTAAAVVDAAEKYQIPKFEPRPDSPGGLVFGGMDADAGEFPYFVNLPGCGGTLIAPDTVLTAAHCGNYQNAAVWVGAWRDQSPDAGAVLRTCNRWISHPNYSTASGLINDFAICILDEPVMINQDEVVLTVNAESEDDFPIIGEELIGMGFGKLNFFPIFPEIIQKTTLEGRVCSSGIPEQVCAGGPGGQNGVTDVCAGDSGGPMIKVVPQVDGPDLHVHVGLVSSGAICPLALTGTYARTSAGAGWINESQCLLGSEYGVDCPPPPEPVVCEDDQSTLVVNVTTDFYSTENRYEFEKQIGRVQFELIAENELVLPLFPSTETFCLNRVETYRWTLFDTFGDGLCFLGNCGSYSLEVDGILIAEGDSFENEVRVVVTGGDSQCDDSANQFKVIKSNGGNLNVECPAAENYLTDNPERAGSVCNAAVVTGGELRDYCIGTCGYYGEGGNLRCETPL